MSFSLLQYDQVADSQLEHAEALPSLFAKHAEPLKLNAPRCQAEVCETQSEEAWHQS